MKKKTAIKLNRFWKEVPTQGLNGNLYVMNDEEWQKLYEKFNDWPDRWFKIKKKGFDLER